MREKRHVAVQRAKTRDEPIGAVRHLLGLFAIRTAVPKHIPTRSFLANVAGEPAFIVAIVPLSQVRFNLHCRTQRGQLTGSPCTLQRTGEHTSKPDMPEPWDELACFVLTARGQGKVGPTSVLTGPRPLGFTVSDNIEAKSHVCSIGSRYSASRRPGGG